MFGQASLVAHGKEYLLMYTINSKNFGREGVFNTVSTLHLLQNNFSKNTQQ
jgi:hypothetical protein